MTTKTQDGQITVYICQGTGCVASGDVTRARPLTGEIMPRKVLVADDSVTIQKVVGISFASEDVKLLTVDNGDDAIARARQTP